MSTSPFDAAHFFVFFNVWSKWSLWIDFLFFPKKCAVHFWYLFAPYSRGFFFLHLSSPAMYLNARARAREVANKCASCYFQNSKCQPPTSNGGEGERTRKNDIKDLGNWICIKSGISHPSCGQVSAAVKTASISAFHSAGLDNVDDGGGGMGKRLQHCDCSSRFPVPPLIADAPRCVCTFVYTLCVLVRVV